MTARCAVLGYASLDHKYVTEPFCGPGHTTLVRRSLHGGGVLPGAAAYFAMGLAGNGVSVDLVSWVGDDEHGALFVDHHRRAGVRVEGVSRTGTRSPVTHMYWPDEGEPVVFFDPGDVDQTLTAVQRRVLASAPGVLVGVGPTAATADALATIPADAFVLWAVKCDPRSVTPELGAALAARADVICHSEAETAFLRDTLGLDLAAVAAGGTLVVETRGARGAVVRRDGRDELVAAPRQVAVEDTTGAGDTFAAGLMARLLQRTDMNETELEDAVLAACADVHALLLARTNES